MVVLTYGIATTSVTVRARLTFQLICVSVRLGLCTLSLLDIGLKEVNAKSIAVLAAPNRDYTVPAPR